MFWANKREGKGRQENNIFMYQPQSATSIVRKMSFWPSKLKRKKQFLARDVVMVAVPYPRVGPWPVKAPGKFSSLLLPLVQQPPFPPKYDNQ